MKFDHDNEPQNQTNESLRKTANSANSQSTGCREVNDRLRIGIAGIDANRQAQPQGAVPLVEPGYLDLANMPPEPKVPIEDGRAVITLIAMLIAFYAIVILIYACSG